MYSLGIDIGTSGIRAVVMDNEHCIISQAEHPLPKSQTLLDENQSIIGYSQKPHEWWSCFEHVLFKIKNAIQQKNLKFTHITHLAIDGTSGTVLLADQSGSPVADALMYNDQRAIVQAEQIKCQAPDNTAAIGVTSGLAKLLWLHKEWLHKEWPHKESLHKKSPHNNQLSGDIKPKIPLAYALNQADWVSGKLLGKYGTSDHNNALKMGYDAQKKCWPCWVIDLLKEHHFETSYLPQVVSPGQPLGNISLAMSHHFGFNQKLQVCAGTTDSTAAIIASGANQSGQAITSLGSTMVMKIISEKPIFNQQSGVYSQPYGKHWLIGGGSNSGGEVLKHYFSTGELLKMTKSLDNKMTQGNFSLLNLKYYPLLAPGERFPIQDASLKPKLLPKPSNELDFFQALLEGMADIEALAYKKLVDLGAPYPKLVRSIGGGANNKSWCYIRQQKLGVSVVMADEQQAAAGSAILAQTTWNQAIVSAHS